jgi:hypothetical protein
MSLERDGYDGPITFCCDECGGEMRAPEPYDDAEAAHLWNTRAALAAHDLAVGERIERLTKALSEIRDLSSDNYDSDRAWALAMQLRARCELHGWLEQRGVK